MQQQTSVLYTNQAYLKKKAKELDCYEWEIEEIENSYFMRHKTQKEYIKGLIADGRYPDINDVKETILKLDGKEIQVDSISDLENIMHSFSVFTLQKISTLFEKAPQDMNRNSSGCNNIEIKEKITDYFKNNTTHHHPVEEEEDEEDWGTPPPSQSNSNLDSEEEEFDAGF